jgi:hypothetical protein
MTCYNVLVEINLDGGRRGSMDNSRKANREATADEIATPCSEADWRIVQRRTTNPGRWRPFPLVQSSSQFQPFLLVGYG